MAPAFDFESDSKSPPSLPDEMGILEATYQVTKIEAGQEVDFFAAELDRYTSTELLRNTTPAERRAQIFRLVGSYYEYTRDRADRLRERLRQERRERSEQSEREGSWQQESGAALRSASKNNNNDMDVDVDADADADADKDADEAEGEGKAEGEDEDSKPTITSADELLKLEEEAHTWDLLRRILPLRYRDRDAAATLPLRSREEGGGAGEGGPRKQYWDDFLLSDSLARERKVVLEWLQSSASNRPPIDEMVRDLQQSAERGDILAHGWLHTRHNIKLQKSVNAHQGVLDPGDKALAESHLASKTLVVTQLDPDAMTRQNRKLEPQDDFFERAIWLGCFEMLRRGRSMAEIREWCSVRTELWRAATMAPLPLSNPEHGDQDAEEGEQGEEGNGDFRPDSLVLWRRMCFATARDGGTGDYDRAVYGLLAGDITSVEMVCKTWDDFLFAHYNALLRTQFDTYLIRRGGDRTARVAQRFPAFNAVLHHSDPITVGKRLIASLGEDARTAGEAGTPSKVLQGALIANDLDRHMYYQGIMLSQDANALTTSKLIPSTDHKVPATVRQERYFTLRDHDSLRVLAHIFVIVSTLDRLSSSSSSSSSGGSGESALSSSPPSHDNIDNDDDANNKNAGGGGPLHVRHQLQELILVAYVSFLRISNRHDSIPLYCSKLQGARRLYQTLGRNLICLDELEARSHQLTLMRKLGLDTVAFARLLPQIFLDDVDSDHAPCDARRFTILVPGPATLKYGRVIRPDFFGEDPDSIDPEDDAIIRSLEWLMLVPDLFLQTCTFAIRAYKYFLKRMHLRAARALFSRVPCRDVAREKTPVAVWTEEEEPSPVWIEDFLGANFPVAWVEAYGASREELLTTFKNLWELECLVRALDAMETLSSVAGISREQGIMTREILQHINKEVQKAKANMQPVLKNWMLDTSQVASDPDWQDLRSAYIPETVLAFVSSLHFAGTSVARDNLLECMELAAVVAERGSDVAQEFVRCGRMRELVEAFASCSKALAIWTSEKKGSSSSHQSHGHGHGSSSKKLREMGWSRELWAVKPS